MNTDLLSSQEAAALLGTTKRTINRWADSGRLPYHSKHPGNGAYLFTRAAVHDLHDRDDVTRTDHEDVPFDPETAA
jgi:excisionase family DNA binding protein